MRGGNYTFSGYDPDDGLTDGRWVQDGFVMRWESHKKPIPPPLPAAPRLTGKTGHCLDCEAPIAKYRKRCEVCAEDAIRANWRRSKRRRAAMQREDAA